MNLESPYYIPDSPKSWAEYQNIRLDLEFIISKLNIIGSFEIQNSLTQNKNIRFGKSNLKRGNESIFK
jgi:hypothetical protein